MKDAVSIFIFLLGCVAIFVGSFYFVEPRSSAGVHAWWGILPRSGADAVQYLVIGLLAIRTGWISLLLDPLQDLSLTQQQGEKKMREVTTVWVDLDARRREASGGILERLADNPTKQPL